MRKIPYLLLITLIAILMTISNCSGNKSGSSEMKIQETTVVDFWNGNRSVARQVYERKILAAILESTEEEWGTWDIEESLEEYPGDEESLVFTEKGHDLFV